jgi:prolyl oligopeptidase
LIEKLEAVQHAMRGPARLAICFVVLTAPLAHAAPTSEVQPIAAIKPVVTNYWGTDVTDNYRWMEASPNPELDAYEKAQNAHTRAILDSIPGRAKLLADLEHDSNLTSFTNGLISMAGFDFYTQVAPGQNTAQLFMRSEVTGAVKLLIDPDKFGKTGQAEAINFFRPSQDGKYVAYGVSEGGSQDETLRVLATATLRDQGVAIGRVDAIFGDGTGASNEFQSVFWLPDDTLAYYREQKPGPSSNPAEQYEKSSAFLHRLGQNPSGDGDLAAFGYGLNPAIKIDRDQDSLIMTIPGCAYAFAVNTENETSDNIDAIYITRIAALEAGKPEWTQLVQKSDNVAGFDAVGDKVFFLTFKNAPHYRVISTSLSAPDLAHAAVIVPETDNVIRAIGAATDALYVDSTDGGFNQIKRYPFAKGATGPAQTLPLPYPGAVDTLVTNETESGAIFTLESWTRSALWYKYDPATGKIVDTGLQKPIGADTADLVSQEVTATSYDGTQIPLSIIMKAGTKLDGKNPTQLFGYGSYGYTDTPSFDPVELPWFNRGAILAFAHVRGGGWYGEDWHKAGMKQTKLNTVFDFIACAQYLVDHHYTSPHYLGGEGQSAGGITIGGAITWRPDLFAAAVDGHGDTDSLRFEFTPNGRPNISEFGTVTNEAGFHGLYAMSPYAHVRDGVPYPAVLLVTGANDPRVAPWSVTKMAARLQAASSSGKPVLLSVSFDSGHGTDDTKDQMDAEIADEMSFSLWQFGVAGFQPR